ncbi:MAG: DHHA1 domain-containing protein [Candidatus Aenigmatarchaeota archaeon]
MNYEKSKKFLQSLEKPTIVYHKDADGVCSAALLQKMVSGNALPNNGPGIQLGEDLLESLKDSESVVFLDIPVDQLSVVEELDQKVFILDHHPPEKDLTGGKVLHENPRFGDAEKYLPASYLVFQLLKEKDKAWKAGVGVVGDHGVEDCQNLFEIIAKENPEVVEEGKYTYENIKEGKLGIIADMIEASKVVEGLDGIRKAQRIIKDASEPNDIFNTELKDFYEIYIKELEVEKEKFEKEAEYFSKSNSYLYEINSQYSLVSDLATSMSNRKPEAVVIVYEKGRNGMKISGRCQSGRIDVSEIIKYAAEGHGTGGGHPQAAGGFVKQGKEEVALERFREKLEGIS